MNNHSQQDKYFNKRSHLHSNQIPKPQDFIKFEANIQPKILNEPMRSPLQLKDRQELKQEPSGVVEPTKKTVGQGPNEGVVPSVGAAALVGMHGFTQPY